MSDNKWKPITELPPLNCIVVGLVWEYEMPRYILFSAHDLGTAITFSADDVTVAFNQDGSRADYEHWIDPRMVNGKLVAWYPIPRPDTDEFVED